MEETRQIKTEKEEKACPSRKKKFHSRKRLGRWFGKRTFLCEKTRQNEKEESKQAEDDKKHLYLSGDLCPEATQKKETPEEKKREPEVGKPIQEDLVEHIACDRQDAD